MLTVVESHDQLCDHLQKNERYLIVCNDLKGLERLASKLTDADLTKAVIIDQTKIDEEGDLKFSG